ncbi:N-formylglutamate amidohydrolase [Limimaricola soesokkakensis]|uniref:N-formylglutamate amidohydrolase n=2 Tax=Limimaricola soesokkakensis TaxID=1343159 RepID=A0A1X6YRW2_9RHOB|nr:N-formylglutamate amidohydrolase [Limimaricola soesokkakensis]SLN28911.1 N-formylglutamate amidohydrolase [Limimaricola soesokkakensis]
MAAFDLTRPAARTSCVVFASPHSGRDYPKSLLARTGLDARLIRSSEDAFVDQLFAAAPEHGAPLLAARVPRAWVDLNRAADELDPALVEGVVRRAHNPRVASGLGVIPRVVAGGRAIYSGKIGLDEARERLDTGWIPYHAALQSLLAESLEQFGESILIDCHSMPHEAIELAGTRGRPRPHVVLGDRYGAAAAPRVMARIEAAFTAAGLRVARNTPFAGAYVTQTYGRPSRRQHAVQIEIDRSLYMDEARIEPHSGFEAFRARLSGVIAEIAVIGAAGSGQLAAE